MKCATAGMFVAAGVMTCGACGAYAQAGAAPAAATNVPARVGMRDAMAFQKMDANKDGKVTLEEYQAAMAATAKLRFEAIDTNKDGVLTEAELDAGRAGMFRRPGGAGVSGQRERGNRPHAKDNAGGAPL